MAYEDNGQEHVMEVNEFLRLTVRSRGFELWHLDTEKGDTTFYIGKKESSRRGKFDFDVKLVYPDGSETVIIGDTPNFTPHFIVLEG